MGTAAALKRRARNPEPISLELVLARPAKKPRKATGAPRGRKSIPQVTPGAMTPAALKRFLVAVAANSARLYYESMKQHGERITWKEAIDHAIDETTYKVAADKQHSPIFVDDDGEALVTYAAVEGQLFPRTRDRKKLR
jgi:hypothetical protein